MRTVIYARYSSQLQNARSCADQVADCRARCSADGWPVVATFSDDAISGAAGIGEEERPGLSAALALIEGGGADQLLAESTDRIARHQGDAFAVRERLEFAGARLFTLLDGHVDDITGTIKGLLDHRFRKDLGARIRRGQRGAVAEGRAPAGLAYGYRTANRIDERGEPIRGLRAIEPGDAAIVRRIFEEYGRGDSPRAIAERLNAEGVKGPKGGTWRATTINGDRVRSNGMLQNELYRGVLVHNRTQKVTDPRTRKVRIRPRPESEWVREAVPNLAIVPEALWLRVQDLRRRHTRLGRAPVRRPRHLLSGLVKCGCCGGGYTVRGSSQWACGKYQDGRACTNNRMIVTHELERRVLDGLTDKLLHPDIVAAYVKEYHLHFARQARKLERDRGGLERRHADALARVERLVAAIAAGGGAHTEILEALSAVKAERDGLAEQLGELEQLPVIALHPRIADDYRRQVAELATALAAPEGRAEVAPILRGLVDQVVLTPRTHGRGVALEVHGRLAAILALAGGAPISEEPCVVEGERVKGIEPSS